MSSPKRKKAKNQPKYDTTYRSEYQTQFSFITKSTKGELYAHCKLCNEDIKISHGGKNDIKIHSQTELHKSNTKAASTPKISSMFATGDMLSKVCHAEGLFSAFVAEHNLSLSVADHFTKLTAKMFPDSTIAERFSCGRTKTTAIIKEALAPHEDQYVTELLQKQPFGLMLDESNDRGTNKQLVILARVYDPSQKKVQSKFIDMPICNVGTGENLFNTVDKVFADRNIPWTNVKSFNSDNCNAMKGHKSGLIAQIRKVAPNVIDVGCVCHLANLAVGEALKTSPVNIDDLLCSINTHFNMSSQRTDLLKDYQQFVGTEQQKLIKHCPTRWLSMHRCLERLLKQYEAVQSYFASHKEAEKRRSKVGFIHATLQDPTTLPWLQFVCHTLEMFTKFNSLFQSEELLIADLHGEMVKLIKKIMLMYCPVEAVDDFQTYDHTHRPQQLDDLDLSIGNRARTTLVSLEEDDITQADVSEFFSNARTLLEASVTKMLDVFPLANHALKLAPIIIPSNRRKFTSQQVTKLAKELSFSTAELDKIEAEWLEMLAEDIPDRDTDPQEFWWASQDSKPTLTKLMWCIMSIPHSNASSERLFSMLKKIYTDERSQLCQGTITALLSVKVNMNCVCYECDFGSDMLRSIKKAARTHNEQYKKPTTVVVET